jgi:uncharacterized protein
MLDLFVNWFVYNLLGFNNNSQTGQILNFFIYDSIKIFFLLFIMITTIGILRTYLLPQTMKKFLKKGKFGIGYFLASLFGALTPFCSCSGIPLFLTFIREKIPKGIMFSFLATSPLVNEYLVIMMFGFFGWKITFAYVTFGILIGIITGIIVDKFNLGRYLKKDLQSKTLKNQKFNSFKSRFIYGINEAKSVTSKIWIWILVGVGIGSLIHNLIPESFIHNILNITGNFTVLLAVLIGVPMYGSCVAILPIALVLFNKGIPLGVALSFLMATSGLSLPEAIILKRTMETKLIIIFFSIITISIIIIGYLFNILSNLL